MKHAAAKDEEAEEKPVLILKPFAARPQISFRQVLVNTQIKKCLYIQNPDPVEITVSTNVFKCLVVRVLGRYNYRCDI